MQGYSLTIAKKCKSQKFLEMQPIVKKSKKKKARECLKMDIYALKHVNNLC